MNMTKQHLTLLVLLDLSAAIDTVDHVILLNRLISNFCISGRVLSWFRSYLHNRSQSVSVNGETSRSFDVKHGVSHDPVLVLSSSFCMSVSYSLSSNAIYQKCTHMLTTRNSTLPSNLSLNMRLMLSQLCKRALLNVKGRCCLSIDDFECSEICKCCS